MLQVRTFGVKFCLVATAPDERRRSWTAAAAVAAAAPCDSSSLAQCALLEVLAEWVGSEAEGEAVVVAEEASVAAEEEEEGGKTRAPLSRWVGGCWFHCRVTGLW